MCCRPQLLRASEISRFCMPSSFVASSIDGVNTPRLPESPDILLQATDPRCDLFSPNHLVPRHPPARYPPAHHRTSTPLRTLLSHQMIRQQEVRYALLNPILMPAVPTHHLPLLHRGLQQQLMQIPRHFLPLLLSSPPWTPILHYPIFVWHGGLRSGGGEVGLFGGERCEAELFNT